MGGWSKKRVSAANIFFLVLWVHKFLVQPEFIQFRCGIRLLVLLRVTSKVMIEFSITSKYTSLEGT